METTGREQIKTETEGEIRGTKDGADFLDEPKNLLERESDVVVEHFLDELLVRVFCFDIFNSISWI